MRHALHVLHVVHGKAALRDVTAGRDISTTPSPVDVC